MPPIRAALAVLLLVLPATGALVAQRAGDSGGTAAERVVTVQNLAPTPRAEWASVVVPFAPGAVPGETPDLHVGDAPTVWQPFGGRWPDGGLRQAIALFPVRMAASSEQALPLRTGPGPEPEASRQFALPPHEIRIEATVGGEDYACVPEPAEFLERNAARQIVVLRGRLGDSGLVVEAPLTVWSGQPHGELGIGVFFSDPSTEAMQVRVQELAVAVDGMGWYPRHSRPLGIVREETRLGTRHVLLRDTLLGDGQGLRRTGALLPPLRRAASEIENDTLQAAAVVPVLAATPWVESGAFGAFGHVPEPPPWMPGRQGVRRAMARQHAQFVGWSVRAAAEPFRAPVWGPAKVPGQAGEQADFGVVAVEPVAWSGLPPFLYEVELSVLQEGCRPVHYFEADATPVLSREHPQLVLWDCRPHWNCDVSPDRLGKPCPSPKFENHGWKGKDREHWSTNYLGAYTLLTAAPSARLEIRNEVQLYLAAQTLREDLYTSRPGVSRAAGRTMLAATWLWLCTGDDALWERMRARMHQVNLKYWATRDDPPGRMHPFQVRGPDPRYFAQEANREKAVWVPWEEALTVIGFEAYLALTGDPDPELREMTDRIALTILRYAYREDARHGAQIAYVMTWEGGRPPTPEEFDDPLRINWPSAPFGMWGMGSLEVARRAAQRAGDEAAERKAEQLLRRLRSGRRARRGGWYDRMSQWDGVRLPPPTR